MDYSKMSIKEISLLPGVSDLKGVMCRGKFAMALKAEAEGKRAEAEVKLNEAVAAEV